MPAAFTASLSAFFKLVIVYEADAGSNPFRLSCLKALFDQQALFDVAAIFSGLAAILEA